MWWHWAFLRVRVSVREINTQWSPNGSTQLLWSQTVKQNGFLACWVGFLWQDVSREPLIPHGVHPAQLLYFAGKNGLLRAERKYYRLNQWNKKWGHFICPWGCPFLALVEDAPTPLIPQPMGKACKVLLQPQLICPPTRNLNQLQIQLPSAFLLIIAVYLDICRPFI